ncbi:nuclear transcription factor Y subunit gamma isoform X2 [Eupeodes corollae]|uniref:nuclear transcription factor Y subunit gamma isoform X2 n=1 Tax=Eupeodes corollae TaxID=290404 RepID=UPI00248F4DC6|nr:nuclear transcription factor Y subunit gamma isoform X2 [Eupeodes corollae]
MSCISSNFSSFFLDSLNDPSEFAKYLSNGENKVQSFEDFQGFAGNGSSNGSYSNSSASLGMNGDSPMYMNGDNPQQQQNLGIQQIYSAVSSHHHGYHHHPHHHPQQQQHSVHPQQQGSSQQTFSHQQPTPRWNSSQTNQVTASGNAAGGVHALADHSSNHHQHPHHHHHPHASQQAAPPQATSSTTQQQQQQPQPQHQHHNHHFDGSFEFLKYLRHSGDYGEDSQSNSTPAPATPCSNSNLIDLDSSTSMTPHSHRTGTPMAAAAATATPLNRSSLDIDTFDHDSKHNLFDLQHQTSNNSNESSCDPMGAFAGVHLNASNSNISSESAGSDNSNNNNNNQSNASKPLVNFSIKDSFDVHPAHKVEEGIFQHMNKLPVKKKDTLKQLGVRFTGQMTLADKSIVVENFIKFCKQYDVTDHRPFLALNQSGMNKPEQIKFARYLGQGLPSFTLFCIYSNFKNLFCTKRTETYEKDGYNLQYILDKTKSFLSKATADLKSLTTTSASNDGVEFPTNNGNNSNNSSSVVVKSEMPKVLERLVFHENFDVHETHRIEDGVCTHIARLPPKKQELLKQFGIQSNQSVTYYEKYIVIENFIKFCNEYKITDHRPFLDFHESGLPKSEQLKFVRYLGQGLPNLTLNKIYLAFKDVLGLNRIEKITADGYNLDVILKKKKKNLYNRMHAAVKI